MRFLLTILFLTALLAAPAWAAKDFNVKDDDQSFLFVNGTSGNVGVGTTELPAQLTVGISPTIVAGSAPATAIKGNLVVDGKIYGDGSNLTGLSGTISGLTTNYVTKATGATTVGNSQIFDNATNVGIGTNEPLAKLHIGVGAPTMALTTPLGANDALVKGRLEVDGNIYTNGNLGIGTTAPTLARLHVIGAAKFGSIGAAPSIGYNSTETYTGLWQLISANTHGDQTMGSNLSINSDQSLYTINNHGTMTGAAILLGGNGNPNGTNSINFFSQTPGAATAGTAIAMSQAVMTIKGGGNVGIGSYAPVARLQVGVNPTITAGSSPATAIKGNLVVDGKIYGDGSGLTGVSGAITGLTATRVPVASGSTTIIDSGIYYVGSNVGIGTSDPRSKLWVDGAVDGTASFVTLRNTGTGNGLLIVSDNSTNVGLTIQTALSTNLSTGRVFSGYVTGDTYGRYMFYSDGKYGIGPGDATRDIFLSRPSANTLLVSSDAAAGMGHLLVTGNVGVGTTVPFAKLEVDGNIYIPNGLGNIGIGSVAPVAQLQVGVNPTIVAGSNPAAAVKGNLVVDGKIYGDGSALTGISAISGLTDNYITRASSATAIENSSMYDDGTNIGIGTAAPRAMLDVDGSVYFKGNVGIGVLSPTSLFEVAGAVAVVGTADSYFSTNVGIGSTTPRTALDVIGTVTATSFAGSGAALTGIAPVNATYITQTADATLSAEQALSTLATGIMRVANSTGVVTSLTDSSGIATNISDEVGTGSLVFNAAPYFTGNVGINTAGPVALLQVGVNPTITAGSLPAAAIKGNLMVDGKIYGDGSALTGVSGAVSGLTATRVPVASGATTLVDSGIYYVGANVGVGTALPLSLLEVGIQKFNVTSAGNVGIGVINPIASLMIVNDSNIPQLYISSTHSYPIIESTLAGQLAEFQMKSTSPGGTLRAGAFLMSAADIEADSHLGISGDNGTNHLKVFNDGSVAIGSTVTTHPSAALAVMSGNVGIGSTGPVALLQVGVNPTITAGSLPAAAIKGNLVVDGKIYGDGSTLTNLPAGISVANATGTIGLVTDDGVAATAMRSDAAPALSQAIAPSWTGIHTFTNATSALLTTGGNVGIGTVSPLAKLHVGVGAPALTLATALGTNDALIKGRLEVDSTVYVSGNVGINTTNPVHPVEVYTSSVSTFVPVAGFFAPNNTTAGNASQMRFGVSPAWGDAAEWRFVYKAHNDEANRLDFGFWGYTEPVMSYLVSGNVGIGTSTPVGLLHVGTSTTAEGLNIFEQASADADSFDINFRKARGAIGAPTVITTADELGTIAFRGYSGAGGYVTGAAIKAISEGTIATTRVPAHLSFWTGTDAAPTVLTERMRIDRAGNVGIGTTVANRLLEVSGVNAAAAIRLRNTGTYAGYFDYYNDGSAHFAADDTYYKSMFFSGDYIGFRGTVNAENTIFITGSTGTMTTVGNIGIGSTHPVARLHIGLNPTITAGSSPAAAIKGNLVVDGKIYGDGSTLTNIAGSISGLTATRVPVASGATTLIDSGIYYVGSNVGIGTTTPVSRLEVGQLTDGSVLTINGGSLGTNMIVLNRDSDSVEQSYGFALASGKLVFYDITNTQPIFYSSYANHGGLGDMSVLNVGAHEANNTNVGLNGLLKSNGAGTLGTDTAGGNLYLASGAGRGNGVRSDVVFFTPDLVGSGTAEQTYSAKMTIKGSGNVGIGTTAPVNLLDVNGKTTFRNYQDFYYASTDPSGKVGSAYEFMDVGHAQDLGIQSYRNIQFGTNNSGATRMILNANGNLGVGTTDPLAKLVVVGTGTGTARALEIDDNLYSPKVVVLDNGNVGIGSTVPASALDVVGSLSIPHSTAPSLTSVGQIALETDSDNFNIRAGSGTAGQVPANTSVAMPLIFQKDVTFVEPDLLITAEDQIPWFAVDSYNYPSGITITAVRVATSASSTDTYSIEEWSAPTTYVEDITTVSLAASLEGTTTTITNASVAAGSYVFIDLDDAQDNVNWCKVTVWFYVND